MSIEWINKEKNTNAVTIYINNITLSKQATSMFDNAIGVVVGFDTANKNIVIKKVTKDELEKKEINKDDIYELTIKPSFGRINNKKLIDQLAKHLDIDFQLFGIQG